MNAPLLAEDGLGRTIGDGLVWVVDHVATNGILVFIAGMVVSYGLWRLSVAFGPQKMCWRCGGDGHIGGMLGGRRDCSYCDGKGRRPRIGSGK